MKNESKGSLLLRGQRNESRGTIFLRGQERADALREHEVKYICDLCGDSMLMPKGDGLMDSIRCSWPCGGTKRQEKWWEEGK